MTKRKKLPALASRAVALFFFLLLLSESTAATVGSQFCSIAVYRDILAAIAIN